jgi:SpoVK/Ycf46/Vps4 family AAA+-type ATPase
MKNIIIKDKRNHQVISGNAISILESLPAAIFELCYDPDRGFSLNEADSFFKNSEKLYGEIEAITERVLCTFNTVEGNLGVLFSGPKGLGKSLTVRNICKEALKDGLPVILVKEHFEKITQFIETICQPAVVVIDEFEKIYLDRNKAKKGDLDGQDSLLNLFDTPLEGKKLFLLTCNDIQNLSEYLLNRPGRIHYHFRANRLSVKEITEYCTDKLAKEQHNLIPDICSLGTRIADFSYDMLRSIIFELNTYQSSLTEVRRILNIEAQAKSPFNFTVCFKSGKIESGFDYIDTSVIRHYITWHDKADKRECASVNMRGAGWSGDENGSLVRDADNIAWSQDGDKKNHDRIERIVFVPAKEGYLASGNNWD